VPSPRSGQVLVLGAKLLGLGDTVVLVNLAVACKMVVGSLRILGPNGFHAAILLNFRARRRT
jgi:hypothetical protein